MVKHRPKPHKLALSAVSLAACLMASGCLDRIDPQKISVMMGMGIDLEEDGMVRVTAQLINTSASGGAKSGNKQGQQKEYLILEEKGQTVEEALQKLYQRSPRHIIFSHNSILIFGADAAKKGFMQMSDYFARSREFRRSQVLLVTRKKAGELLRSITGVESIPSRGLHELIAAQKNTSMALETTGLIVVNQYLSPSHATMLSWIDADSKKEAVIKGVAIFRGDQLVDWLSKNDARGILWFLGKVKKTQLILPCKESKDSIMGTLVELTRSKVKVEPTISESGPKFHVQVRGEGQLGSLCSKEQLTPSMILSLEKEFSKMIQMEMNHSISRLQENKADVVQFGKKIFEKYPQWWRKNAKQWKDLFPNVNVTYDVQIKLLGSGRISEQPKSFYSPENLVPKLKWEEDQP